MFDLLVHRECYTVHHGRLSESDLFSPLSWWSVPRLLGDFEHIDTTEAQQKPEAGHGRSICPGNYPTTENSEVTRKLPLAFCADLPASPSASQVNSRPGATKPRCQPRSCCNWKVPQPARGVSGRSQSILARSFAAGRSLWVADRTGPTVSQQSLVGLVPLDVGPFPNLGS
jgi:hypothetical protein